MTVRVNWYLSKNQYIWILPWTDMNPKLLENLGMYILTRVWTITFRKLVEAASLAVRAFFCATAKGCMHQGNVNFAIQIYN